MMRKRHKQEFLKIQAIINSITSDEDDRQDLWVSYLSGENHAFFIHIIDKNKQKEQFEQKYLQKAHELMCSPLIDKLLKSLQNLSELELSVTCLLIIGCETSEISRYKGISQVYVQHIINTVSKRLQEESWLLKLDLQMKKNSA